MSGMANEVEVKANKQYPINECKILDSKDMMHGIIKKEY